jgi:hypothetical protein
VAIEQDLSMTLTVGASLQQNKYEIQDILSLSDLGATYKARHVYLDQPVILQTFNEVAQQRPDLEQLKRRFQQEVQLLAKRSALPVLDCFEENGLPFVVLPFVPNQGVPKLGDWLPIATTAPNPSNSSIFAASELKTDSPSSHPVSTETRSQLAQPSSSATAATLSQASMQTLAQPQTLIQPPPKASHTLPQVQILEPPAPDPENLAPNVAANRTITSEPSSSNASSAVTAFPTTVTQNVPAAERTSKWLPSRATQRKIPAALMLAALIGGFAGAGMGLALRMAVTPQPNGKAALNFINKEQTFPSEGNWPIRQRAIFTPEPTIEQPLYRTNTPSEYVAPAPIPYEPYQPYSSPYSEGRSVEVAPEAPTTDLPTESLPAQPTVELPADVDSLYTDEWLPSIEAPAPRSSSPDIPLAPSEFEGLPPQSTQPPTEPLSKKLPSRGSLSVVSQ